MAISFCFRATRLLQDKECYIFVVVVVFDPLYISMKMSCNIKAVLNFKKWRCLKKKIIFKNLHSVQLDKFSFSNLTYFLIII